MNVSTFACDLTVPINSVAKDVARDRIMPLVQALCDPPGEWEKAGEAEDDVHPQMRKHFAEEKCAPSSSSSPSTGSKKNEVWANFDYCAACGRGGKIICCEGCPRSYHLTCLLPPLKEKDIPKGDWICDRCIEIKKRNERGESIPRTVKILLPEEKQRALAAAEKLKLRPEKSGRQDAVHEKPKSFRKKKYAYDAVLMDIKKKRKDAETALNAETDYLESLVQDSARQKSPEGDTLKPDALEAEAPTSEIPAPLPPKKTRKARTQKKKIVSKEEVRIAFSAEKTRKKMVGTGEKAVLDVFDELICAATTLEAETFVLAPEVIIFHQQPDAFVEPAKIPVKKYFKKLVAGSKEEGDMAAESFQSKRFEEEEPNFSSNLPILDEDDDGDNQYLEDMRNKPPSPIITRKRETNSVIRASSKSSPLPVEALLAAVKEAELQTTGIPLVSGSRGVAEALEKVKRDMPLQSLKRYRVLHGIPRIFPANLFPGELRKDSCYGGTELKPVLLTEHIRRNERGRGPLLCAKCNEGCIRKPLLQCDYCPSYYHLECMDPPMMEPPRTLWMCPLHPIRVIEQKLLKDCRRSSRVKLWRREISLPVNESRVFLDFLRKIRRERAPNSSDDPRDVSVSPTLVSIHPAVKEAYERRADSISMNQIGKRTEDATVDTPSGATLEETQIFLGAIARFHEESSQPTPLGSAVECEADPVPETTSKDDESEPSTLSLRTETFEDETTDTKEHFAQEPLLVPAKVERKADPLGVTEKLKDGRIFHIENDSTLTIGWEPGQKQNLCRSAPKVVTCHRRDEFVQFGRRLLACLELSLSVAETIPWGTLQEISLTFCDGQKSVVKLLEEKKTLKDIALKRLQLTLPAGVRIPEGRVDWRTESIGLRLNGTKDPVDSLLSKLSPEVKDELLRRYITTLVYAEREEKQPSRMHPHGSSLLSMMQMRPEFRLGREPLALIAPVREDGCLDGEPFPIFDYSFVVGTAPQSTLLLNKAGERRCRFISPHHAEIIFIRRESRFECINYSRFGTFVDDHFYCFGELEEPEDLVEEIPTCSCGVFPSRRTEALTGWGETAAQLHHGSLIRFGCLNYVFVLPGNTLPSMDDEDDGIADGSEGLCCDGLLFTEDEAPGPSTVRDRDTDDSDCDDAPRKFSPRKTRSMIQMRLTSTGN